MSLHVYKSSCILSADASILAELLPLLSIMGWYEQLNKKPNTNQKNTNHKKYFIKVYYIVLYFILFYNYLLYLIVSYLNIVHLNLFDFNEVQC